MYVALHDTYSPCIWAIKWMTVTWAVCVAYMGLKEIHKVHCANLKERDHLEVLDTLGMIILKFILKKW